MKPYPKNYVGFDFKAKTTCAFYVAIKYINAGEINAFYHEKRELVINDEEERSKYSQEVLIVPTVISCKSSSRKKREKWRGKYEIRWFSNT